MSANRKWPPRAEHLRRAIAQEAARVMAEHGIRDFLVAKRKAAERFGVADAGMLPKNTEIEAALAEYQRLFAADAHAQSLRAQRRAAVTAMQYLAEFEPRLVGAVLSGTATQYSDVQLHVFADRAENVALKLMDNGVPFETGERRIKMNADRVLAQPCLKLEIDGQTIDVVVFPIDGIRQAPVSPVDGKPMKRAGLAEVEALLGQRLSIGT
ncbi:MAG: hypothetical protein NZM12_04545 [Steroidobacteraceae bacterium]|nr:hypothetical protein [Steroidobacteraceae bacterium]MDW8258300.1 hypothetical protein [Gammaproteobacteria bacterium]